MLAGKGMNTAGEGIIRVGYESRKWFLMPPYPLTNFEIQNYYQNEPRLNGVYSRDNLPGKIKDGIFNKSGWEFWYWNSLDCFVCIEQ